MADLSNEDKAVNSRFLDAYIWLKKNRIVKNKTDFCTRLQMPQGYISMFEKEERPVPNQYIDKLSKEFNISADWVRYNQGDMLSTEQGSRTSITFSGNKLKDRSAQAGGNVSYNKGSEECEQQLAMAQLKIAEQERTLVSQKEEITFLRELLKSK